MVKNLELYYFMPTQLWQELLEKIPMESFIKS